MRRFYMILFGLITAITAPLSAGKFFVKVGGGAGYDTNPMLSLSSAGGIFGTAHLFAEGLTGEKPYEVYGSADITGVLNTNYVLLDSEGTIGIVYNPSLFTILRALLSYRYQVDINNAIKAMFDLRHDLGSIFTGHAGYEYDSAYTLAGIPHESVFSHKLIIGGNMDFFRIGYFDFEFNYMQRNYFQLTIASNTLKNDLLKGSLLFSIYLDYSLTLKLGYGISRYISSGNTLIVYSTTNQIIRYNTGWKQSAVLGLEWNPAPEYQLSLIGLVEYSSMDIPQKGELVYSAGILNSIYLTPSWKIEIPLTYSARKSELVPEFERIRAAIEIYFLY